MSSPILTPIADDPIITLLTTFSELNSSQIEELDELPSALEFMRYVSLNRPFVVRGGVSDWEAVQAWNIETLKKAMDGQMVNVAITPNGYELFIIRVKDLNHESLTVTES